FFMADISRSIVSRSPSSRRRASGGVTGTSCSRVFGRHPGGTTAPLPFRCTYPRIGVGWRTSLPSWSGYPLVLSGTLFHIDTSLRVGRLFPSVLRGVFALGIYVASVFNRINLPLRGSCLTLPLISYVWILNSGVG